MRRAIRNINQTGVTLSKGKTIEVIRKYSVLHNSMCERLYDLGYISTPLYYDNVDFWTTFLNTYPELSEEFLNKRTGEMNYSLPVIHYVIKKTTDSDVKLALNTVVSLLESENALKDLATLCDYVKFQKKKDTVVSKVNLGIIKSVCNSNKIPLDSTYVRECFYTEPSEQIVEINYSIVLLKYLLKMLDLPNDVQLTDASVFLGVGFTIKDDCDNLEALVNSDIRGTGIYYDKLFEKVESYYTEYYSNRTTKTVCIDFYSKLFTDALQDCIDYLAEQRTSYPDAKDFYVTSSALYLSVASNSQERFDFPDEVFVGERLYNLKGEVYSPVNRLLGYSGIYVYEYDSDIYKYATSGLPVELYATQKRGVDTVAVPMNCYPLDMIKERYQDGLVDIYPKDFCKNENFLSKEEMLTKLDVDSIESLPQEVSAIVKKGNSQFKLLVGRMFQTLICIKCDYTLADHISPNQLKIGEFKAWLTKEVYLEACIEASSLFELFGF